MGSYRVKYICAYFGNCPGTSSALSVKQSVGTDIFVKLDQYGTRSTIDRVMDAASYMVGKALGLGH
jgi:hypothetical protein